MIKHTEHPDLEKQYNAIGTPFLYLDKQKFFEQPCSNAQPYVETRHTTKTPL